MPVTADQFDPFSVDTTELSLEEIKAKANAGEAMPGEPVRNADGTFAGKKAPVVPVADVQVDGVDEGEEDQVIYQRRIDLGDGAGVQVFQGNSMEELVDKLVVAQENATKKIRQQSAELEKNKPVVKVRTDDDEFQLAQEFATKPSAAFEKLFQEQVGMPLSEFKNNVEAVKAFNASQTAANESDNFVKSNPEYYPSPANGKKIQGYLKAYNLPITAVNLTQAYKELSSEGLLVAKPAEDGTERIVVKKKGGSGLPARGGAAVPGTKRELKTQADFEEATKGLTTDQIRALANNQTPGAKKDMWDF